MQHLASCEHVRQFSELTEAVAADNADSADITMHGTPLVQIRTTGFGLVLVN